MLCAMKPPDIPQYPDAGEAFWGGESIASGEGMALPPPIGVTSEPIGAWLPGGARHSALVRAWTVPPATLQQRGSCPRARR
jgi:hypothetical protein